ncbi:hypothetical protein DL96DRAFT_1606647 [Flagelloscypha sp. PMI_526]|nr:hypothetical protein DL96DRAFT_1606647 [Flagelloscypha sp. PMI_526]
MSSQSPKPVSNSQNNSGPLSHSAPAVSNPQPTLECIPAPKLNYTPPPKPASHSREPNALGTQNSSATKLVKSVVPKAQDLGSSSMVQPKGAPNPSKTKAPNSQKTGMAMSQKSGATKPKKSSAKKSQKSNVTKSLQSGTTKSQTTDTSKSQKGVKPNTQTTKG